MRLSTFSFFAAAGVFFGGCNPPAATSNSSVVVDLDAVARAMGRDLVIERKVEQATQALNTKLLAAADSMEKEYKKQQDAAGASPTDEQRAKLKQMAQRIQETIQSNKEIASQARERVRLDQIQSFRNDVKAVAAKIAEKQHAAMVVVAGQEVLWFKPTADITAAVIADMRTQALSPSESDTNAAASNAPSQASPAVTNAAQAAETNR